MAPLNGLITVQARKPFLAFSILHSCSISGSRMLQVIATNSFVRFSCISSWDSLKRFSTKPFRRAFGRGDVQRTIIITSYISQTDLVAMLHFGTSRLYHRIKNLNICAGHSACDRNQFNLWQSSFASLINRSLGTINIKNFLTSAIRIWRPYFSKFWTSLSVSAKKWFESNQKKLAALEYLPFLIPIHSIFNASSMCQITRLYKSLL